MKNKGRAISLAICIGVLNSQMAAPYYTSIARAEGLGDLEASDSKEAKEGLEKNKERDDSEERESSEREDSKEKDSKEEDSEKEDSKEEEASEKEDSKEEEASEKEDSKEEEASEKEDSKEGEASEKEDSKEGEASEKEDSKEGEESEKEDSKEEDSEKEDSKEEEESEKEDSKEGEESEKEDSKEGEDSEKEDSKEDDSKEGEESEEEESKEDDSEEEDSKEEDSPEGKPGSGNLQEEAEEETEEETEEEQDIKGPAEELDRIMLNFKLAGISYKDKLPKSLSLDELEAELKTIGQGLESEDEDSFYSIFEAWYLDEDYKEELRLDRLDKDIKELSLYPLLRDIKEIEYKFHNESKLDLKLPKNIKLKKGQIVEMDQLDENIEGFHLRDEDRLWDFSKDRPEDNLHALEGEASLNFYARLIQDIEIEEDIKGSGDYKLRGKVEKGQEMELLIEPAKGYIVEKARVLDSKGQLLQEGENLEKLKFKLDDLSLKIEIDFVERPENIEELDIEISANGGSFLIDGKESSQHKVKLDYYSQLDILKDLEEGLERKLKVQEGKGFSIYEFKGWYLDEGASQKFDTNSRLTKDTKIYAGWEESLSQELRVRFKSGLDEKDQPKMPEDQVFKFDQLGLVEEPEKIVYNSRDFDSYSLKAWTISELEDEKSTWDFKEDKLADRLDKLKTEKNKVYLDLYASWEVSDLFDTGTKAQPFEIKSADAIGALAKKVNRGKSYKDKYFILADNIDLSGLEDFKPIGNKDKYFSGNLSSKKVEAVKKVDEVEDKKVDETEEKELEVIETEDKKVDEIERQVKDLEEREVEKTDKEEAEETEETDEEGIEEEGIEEEKEEIQSDDDYYKIIGLDIKGKEDYQGLFGHIRGARIENLIVEGSVSGGNMVGGLVGLAGEGSRIENSISRVDVKGLKNVGGLIGSSEGSLRLEGLLNENKVVGDENVAGLVGELGKNSVALDLVNKGDIRGKKAVAGIVALVGDDSNLARLENRGEIQLEGLGGGIAASLGENVSMEGLDNYGKIIASGNRLGGILGSSQAGLSLRGARNSAELEGDSELGGILGYASAAIKEIRDSENSGRIKGKGSQVGGIVGLIDSRSGGRSRLVKLSNKGEIKGKSNVAGILAGKGGNISGINIEKVYNQGKISAEDKLAGGIVAYLPKASYILDSYNVGLIEANNTLGGISAETYHTNSNIEVNSSYIRDSYNYGRIDGKKAGAILSTGYKDKNQNNFYLKGSLDEIEDKADSLTELTRSSFESGELAYLLDLRQDGLRKGLWSQGHAYPVFAGGDKKGIYKIDLDIKGSSYGSVKLDKTYVNGRDRVELRIQPDLRKILKRIDIKDSKNKHYEIEISENNYSFNMQEEDVKILVEFMEEPLAEEYKVDFKLDGKIYESKKVRAGQRVEKPEDPKKEGLKFMGWHLDGKNYNFANAVLKNLSLEARFMEADQLEVNFDNNIPEGQEGSQAIEPVKLKKGSRLVRPQDPTRKSSNRLLSYEFKGWFTEKTDGKEWNFSQEVENSMTLYAQWEEKNDIPDGFEFKTAQELRILGDSVNTGNTHAGKTFYLANDIDLNDWDKEWESIGYHNHLELSFADGSLNSIGRSVAQGSLVLDARLDGRNHTVTLQPGQSQSFIGSIGKKGVLRNINIYGKMAPNEKRQSFGGLVGYSYGLIENVDVVLEQEQAGAPTYSAQSGGLVAGNFADIKNVTVKVEMVSFSVMPGNIGGVAGATQSGKIEDITVKSGSVIKVITDNDYALAYSGGAFGLGFGNSRSSDYFKNIVVEDGVLVESDSPGVGGIMGNGVGHIIDSYNGADVYNSKNSGIGGIIGLDYSGSGGTIIERTINTGTITGVAQGTSWLTGIGGISGGTSMSGGVGEAIIDSYSLGTVRALDGGEVNGLASEVYDIKNSYFFGQLDGEAIAISVAADVENTYYGSDDQDLTDDNDNPDMNSTDIKDDLDYSGSKKASREQFKNGEVAYYLNNVDGKQRKKLLWGVNPETKLPDFGGIYYVRLAVDEIDNSKGEAYLVDKQTGEEIELESERYIFVKKDHAYDVKVKIKSQEKNEEGKDLGYGFDRLKISIGDGDEKESIDLLEKFENKEEIIVSKDGQTETEQSQELDLTEKEKPVIPQEPEEPSQPEKPSKPDKPGTETGQGDKDGSGKGSGKGGRGDGKDRGESKGEGQGQGQGDKDGDSQGTGKLEAKEKEGQGNLNKEEGKDEKPSQEPEKEAESLVESDKKEEETLMASSKESRQELKSRQDSPEEEEEEEAEPLEEVEEEREDEEEVEEEQKEEIEEDDASERSLSFVEKLVDRLKANPLLAAVVAAAFILANMALSFFRFKKKNSKDERDKK